MRDLQTINILNKIESIASKLVKDQDSSINPNDVEIKRFTVSLVGVAYPKFYVNNLNLVRSFVHDNYGRVMSADDLFFGRWIDPDTNIV